jgi:D-alanyl-D-alanine carboxypeptidase
MRTLAVRSLLAAGVLVLAAAHFLPPSSGSQAQAWLDEPPGTEPDSESATDIETGAQTPAPLGQLHPGLVAALTEAQQAAATEGFDLVVTSGYRTPERQQELLDEEIAERGSYEEASRWVFPPDRSMHVQGLAIDVGDGPAADWLDANGSAWGLCRTLDWEWWHFEWRERWESAGSCPPPAVDVAGAPSSSQP